MKDFWQRFTNIHISVLKWKFSPPTLVTGAVFITIIFSVVWITEKRPAKRPPVPIKTYKVVPDVQIEAERSTSSETPSKPRPSVLGKRIGTQGSEETVPTPETIQEQTRAASITDPAAGEEGTVGKGHYTPSADEYAQSLRIRLEEIRQRLHEFPQGRITMAEFAEIQALRTERTEIEHQLGILRKGEAEEVKANLEIQSLLAGSMSEDAPGFRVSDAPRLIEGFKKAGAFDMAEAFQKASERAEAAGEAFFTLSPEN